MPPAVGALAAIGGGSAVAGGLGLAAGAAGLYGAKRDRDSVENANAEQLRARQESQDYIKQASEQARSDIFQLFPEAQESRQAGISAGLDFLKQSAPLQMGAFQQGNMGAQRAISAGLPQMQAALLGQPIDYSQIQPQQINTSGIGQLMQSAQIPQVSGIGQQFNVGADASRPGMYQTGNSAVQRFGPAWSDYDYL